MARLIAWFRWFIAGPQQNIELATEVGKSLHAIEKRLSNIEHWISLRLSHSDVGVLCADVSRFQKTSDSTWDELVKMHAEMGDVRAAQRQLQDLQKELEKPELVRPRTASNFRRLVEGDNAA